MAIEIKEQYSVAAPIDAVWQFMLDPQQVVVCLPGAKLDEVVSERSFLGTVKIKLGAVTTSYKGRVELTEIDEQAHAIVMVAEGRETGGGTAKATLTSELRELPDGQTEIVTLAQLDLTGRIVQVGRGMIQGVSHQIFQQFAASTKERLELPSGSPPQTAPAEPTAIRIVPVLFKTVWSALQNLLRRIFGRPLSE